MTLMEGNLFQIWWRLGPSCLSGKRNTGQWAEAPSLVFHHLLWQSISWSSSYAALTVKWGNYAVLHEASRRLLGNQTWWVCSRTQGTLWKNSIALWKCPASLCSSQKQKVCWWTLQIVLLHWIVIDPKLLPYLFHVWLKVSLYVMNCGLTPHGDCITYSGNKSRRVT